MKNEPLIVERVYQATLKQVWEAITNPDKIKEWFSELNGFKAEIGNRFTFYGEDKGRKYFHQCEVLEVEPQKKLSYSWTYENYEGNSVVTFQLFPEGNSTRLVLTHAGLETFMPEKNPELARSNFEKGWDEILTKGLAGHLAKMA